MKHYTRNPRKITNSQMARLGDTLARLGDISGIVHDLNSDQIIGGNQRVTAMRLEGTTPTILQSFDPPTAQGTVALGYLDWQGERFAYRAVRWTPEQCAEANIVANAAGGSWDWSVLKSDFDASLLAQAGLDADALAAVQEDSKALALLVAPEPAAVDDEGAAGELVDRAEQLQEKWKCKTGDIWTAAGHFWICGDCRDAETWARLMKMAGVEKVNGVFTSPPYAEQRKKQYGGVPSDKYVEWWEAVQANVRANLASDGSFFVNIKPHCEDGERVLYVFDLVLAMKRLYIWLFRDEFIWKHSGYPGENKFRHRNQFEPVYHFSLNQAIKHRPLSVGVPSRDIYDYSAGIRTSPTNADSDKDAGRKAKTKTGIAQVGNVVEAGLNNDATGHKGVFPVALPTFFVKAYSDAGDVWCDPFLGSGTTIIAAHREERRGLGIEMLEKYCAVICERIEKETGKTPRRVESA